MTYIFVTTIMNRAGGMYDIVREAHTLPLTSATLDAMLTAFEKDITADMAVGDIQRASVVTDKAGRVYIQHHE